MAEENETVGNEELVEVITPELESLAQKGAVNIDTAEKIAQTLAWGRDKTKEFTDRYEILLNGAAKKDKNGALVPAQVKDPETGEMVDVEGKIQIEDGKREGFNKAVKELREKRIGLSGVKLTRDDLPKDTLPITMANLGPLYVWGAVSKPKRKKPLKAI